MQTDKTANDDRSYRGPSDNGSRLAQAAPFGEQPSIRLEHHLVDMLMVLSRCFKMGAAVLIPLGIGGCDLRDCALGIANVDCLPLGSPVAQFPQDDAVCRSYRLEPGTRDYAICREAKLHERSLTERATDFGALQNPVTPDVRPVVQAR